MKMMNDDEIVIIGGLNDLVSVSSSDRGNTNQISSTTTTDEQASIGQASSG